jgi:hypothetical protein
MTSSFTFTVNSCIQIDLYFGVMPSGVPRSRRSPEGKSNHVAPHQKQNPVSGGTKYRHAGSYDGNRNKETARFGPRIPFMPKEEAFDHG